MLSKSRLHTTFVVGCCVVVVLHRFMPSLLNQRAYFARPIADQSNGLNTSFSLGPCNPNCSPNGYLLVMRYGGQQAGGIKSLVSLQRWMQYVGLAMMIVEPFIQDSILGTYRKSYQELKFSDMFDLENFNSVSRSEGVSELIPWETYVDCAPVHAVLVRMKETESPAPPKMEWDSRPGNSDCWLNSDEKYNITINNRRLCYVRVVNCFRQLSHPSHIFSNRELHRTFLAGLELSTVNLVFDIWRMTWHTARAHYKPVPSYLYGLSASQEKNGSVFLTHNLQDSLKLLLDVKNYQKQFLMTQRFDGCLSYVAVMLRIEYITMIQKYAKGSINFTQLQDLLDETVNVTATMMAELGIEDVFVTADIGLYGSKTWKATLLHKAFRNGVWARVEEQIKSTVEKLYKNKWTFEEWEKSFLRPQEV